MITLLIADHPGMATCDRIVVEEEAEAEAAEAIRLQATTLLVAKLNLLDATT